MKDTSRQEAITQRRLARILGLSPSQFCQILKGVKRVSPLNAARLERESGISLRHWLLGTPDELRKALEDVYGKVSFKLGRPPGKREASK